MQRFEIDLSCVDVINLQRSVEDVRRRGYVFTTLASLEPECVYWLHQECRKRQPPLHTHQEPQDYRRWVEVWMAQPKAYHVLLEGQKGIAVCGLHITDTIGVQECGFTGVSPSHSGQGLAFAIKARAMLKASEQRVRTLVTRVRDDNLAMIVVNRRLGFVPAETS